jgi:hypothetical protein
VGGCPPGAHPDDTLRKAAWKRARSELVDTFLAIDGKGTAARFKNQAIPKIVPIVLDLLREQVVARCPDRSPTGDCTWARNELSASMADTIGGPTFAAAVDLLDAIRRDDAARTEIERLVVYLLDASSENDAEAATLSALVDILQVLDDDVNLAPFYHLMSTAVAPESKGPDGELKRGLADAGIDMMARILAIANDAAGKEICAKEIDPERTIEALLKNLVRPMKDGRIPLEILSGIIADVNRADPSSKGKLAGADFANMAKEMSAFFLDQSSGLEQIWAILRKLEPAPK